jgi:hypothetical protein
MIVLDKETLLDEMRKLGGRSKSVYTMTYQLRVSSSTFNSMKKEAHACATAEPMNSRRLTVGLESVNLAS